MSLVENIYVYVYICVVMISLHLHDFYREAVEVVDYITVAYIQSTPK